MSVGNGLRTPVGSNWLHVVAMTLKTKQQQQQQQQQQNKTKRQCSYGSPGVGTMPQFAHKSEMQCSKKYTFT